MTQIKTLTFFSALILVCCGQSTPQFNAESGFSFLQKQVDFGPRNPGSKGHSKCRDWLDQELKKSADRVLRQNFTHKDVRLDTVIKMTNLVASFNLQNGARIMLCAHWDTRPMADQDIPENKNKPILGANDGASGVAVLLEIARVMKENPPEIGVDIILLDGEDYGPEGNNDEYFLGSRYFVKNLQGYKPRFGILLDMVGDAQLDLLVEYQSGRYAGKIVDKVWTAAEDLGFTQFKRQNGSAVNDDHVQFLQAGIPCIDIIDFDYPDASKAYWHTLQDTPDKCDPLSLKVVGQTLLKVIYDES